MSRKKRRIYGILVLGLAAVAIIAVAIFLHTQNAYVPDNTVEQMDVQRSQVYLSGKGYTIDKQQAKEHNKTEKAREAENKKNTTARQNDPKGVEEDDSVAVKNKSNKQTVEPTTPANTKPPSADEPEDVTKKQGQDEGLTQEEREKLPTISTNLVAGENINGSSKKFWVTATDYKKRNIPVLSVGEGKITVTCNDEKIASSGESGNRTYFKPVMKDGKNIIRITAIDRNGNKRTVTKTVNCNTSQKAEEVGEVSISVTASVVGLGTLTSATLEITTEGESVEDLLKTALEKGGYGYSIGKGYLAAISKNNIAKGWKISDRDRDRLKENDEPAAELEKTNLNELREHDFYSSSGWMYSVNGEIPNIGMKSYVPVDGDEIKVFFVLSKSVY